MGECTAISTSFFFLGLYLGVTCLSGQAVEFRPSTESELNTCIEQRDHFGGQLEDKENELIKKDEEIEILVAEADQALRAKEIELKEACQKEVARIRSEASRVTKNRRANISELEKLVSLLQIKIHVEEPAIRPSVARFVIHTDRKVRVKATLFLVRGNHEQELASYLSDTEDFLHPIKLSGLRSEEIHRIKISTLDKDFNELPMKDLDEVSRDRLRFVAPKERKVPVVSILNKKPGDLRSNSVIVRFQTRMYPNCAGYVEFKCEENSPGKRKRKPCNTLGEVLFDKLGYPHGAYPIITDHKEQPAMAGLDGGREKSQIEIIDINQEIEIEGLQEQTEYILTPTVYCHEDEKSEDPMGNDVSYTTTKAQPPFAFKGRFEFTAKKKSYELSWGTTREPKNVQLRLTRGRLEYRRDLNDMKIGSNRIHAKIFKEPRDAKKLGKKLSSELTVRIEMTGPDNEELIREFKLDILER